MLEVKFVMNVMWSCIYFFHRSVLSAPVLEDSKEYFGHLSHAGLEFCVMIDGPEFNNL